MISTKNSLTDEDVVFIVHTENVSFVKGLLYESQIMDHVTKKERSMVSSIFYLIDAKLEEWISCVCPLLV